MMMMMLLTSCFKRAAVRIKLRHVSRSTLYSLDLEHKYTTLSDNGSNSNSNRSIMEGLMKLANRQAQYAFREKEVPIGSIVVGPSGDVLATARNQMEQGGGEVVIGRQLNLNGHAEIIALKKSIAVISRSTNVCDDFYDDNVNSNSSSSSSSGGRSRNAQPLLNGCTLLTTLEPCKLCYDAIVASGVSHLVYAAKDSVSGVFSSADQGNISTIFRRDLDGVEERIIIASEKSHLKVSAGVLEQESALMLRRYYMLRKTEKFSKGDIDRARAFRVQTS